VIHRVVIYIFILILKKLNLDYYFTDKLSSGTGSSLFDTMITISYTILSIFIAIFMHRYIKKKFRIKESI
jgi:hypothetical protein